MSVNFRFQAFTIASLLSAHALCGQSDTARQSIFTHPTFYRPIRRRNDDSTRLSPRQTSTSNGHAYTSFTFSAGQSVLNNRPSLLRVQFPYTLGNSTQSQLYDESSRLKANYRPQQTYTFGIEFGMDNSSFIGFNFFAYNSHFPNSTFGDNASAEFYYGYNFVLNDRFRFRPMVMVDVNTLFVRYQNLINNDHQDIHILGKTFPYSYITSSRYGSHQHYAKSAVVGYEEDVGLVKLRAELSYKVSPVINLFANTGYTWAFSRSQSIKIHDGSKISNFPLNTNGLNFTSTEPTNKLFDYNGMYWNVGIAFVFRGKKNR